MARAKYTPDELVDAEIERLKGLDTVKLARREQAILNRKRQILAQLRWLDRRGQKLMKEGWTYDTLELLLRDVSDETNE